jgi:hypothetical protein
MAKIGRNEPCPCGSGQKFKKCCLNKLATVMPQTAVAQEKVQTPRLSLNAEVEKIQKAAVDRKNSLYTLGVFVFFSTDNGDGWLLEVSEMDALQVAKDGQVIEVEIEEKEETIEVNWSHKFSIKNKLFQVKDYKSKESASYPDYPGNRIAKAVTKVRGQFPQEMLEQVHIQEEEAEA